MSLLSEAEELIKKYAVQGDQSGIYMPNDASDWIAKVAKRPVVVCLCGSTRFWRTFQEASLRETLAGKIVLSIGAARSTDEDDHSFGGYVPADEYDAVKERLDELYKRKIDLADEVLILNVGKLRGRVNSA